MEQSTHLAHMRKITLHSALSELNKIYFNLQTSAVQLNDSYQAIIKTGLRLVTDLFYSPNVNERGLPPTPLVAQEQLGALQTAMIEVGRLAAVGAVDAGEALGDRFSRRPVDDGQVGDGRFGPAGLGLRQVLLQRGGLVRQPGHYKVVGHAVTLVLDHGWEYLEGRT